MKTKYQKTKQLMKSTGLSKKECQELLRSCKWDYDAAYESTLLLDVDWVAVGDALVNTINAFNSMINRLAEELPKMLDAITEMIRRAEEQWDHDDERV